MASVILRFILLAVLAAFIVKMVSAASRKKNSTGSAPRDRFDPGKRPIKDARFTEVDPK